MSDKDTVESIIDRQGLYAVLVAISDICYEKAEHIEYNWQDENTALPWRHAGRRISTEAERVRREQD